MQQSDQTNSDLHVGAVVLVATAHISEPEDSELLAKRKSRFSRNRTGADVLEHGCNLRKKSRRCLTTIDLSEFLVSFECGPNLSAFSRPGMQIELTLLNDIAVLPTTYEAQELA